MIYTILGIIGAFYFKELIDNILPNGLRKTLMTLSIGVILLNVFKVLLNAFNKWYEKLNHEEMEANAQLTSYMVESLNGIQTVKAYNSERKIKQETEFKFVKLLKKVFNLVWSITFNHHLKHLSNL